MHIDYLSLPNVDFGCIECTATEVNIKTEGAASAFYIENCTTVRLDSVTELSSFYFAYWDAAVSKKKQQTKTIYGLNVGAGVEYISAKSLRALKPKTSGGQLGTLLSNAPNLKQANLDALEEASTTSSYGYKSYVQMFYNCPELDAVYLPNYTGGCSTTNSFSKCDKLRIVQVGPETIVSGTDSIANSVLKNTNANMLVPVSKYDEYVAAYPSYVDRIMKYS